MISRQPHCAFGCHWRWYFNQPKLVQQHQGQWRVIDAITHYSLLLFGIIFFNIQTCVSNSIAPSGVIGSTISLHSSKSESCLPIPLRLWASLEALINSTQPVRQHYGRWRVIDAITHYSLCSFAVFSLLTWYIIDQIILSYSVTNMFILETYESTSQYGQATHYVML